MPTTLQVRFGHEENFSRYLLESGQFEQLLARAGFAVAGEGALEVPVAKGHEGREGRLDIYQPTTAGVVIGEMQYGTSDSNHRNRFAGYAKSVTSPAAIVWVAERFRDKDLQAVAGSKVPVLCVTAKLSAANNIVLTAIGGARLSAQTLEKRVARANAKAAALLKNDEIIAATTKWVDDAIQTAAYMGNDWRFPKTTEDLIDKVLEETTYLFAKTTPAHFRRLDEVRASAFFLEWKNSFAAQVEPIWAGIQERVAERRLQVERERAEEQRRWDAEIERRRTERDNAEAAWNAEREQQAAIPELEAVKQAALDAYCGYMDDSSLFAAVRELYLAAEEACIAAGFKWLTGMPLVCKFIPERYACGRPLV
jgi:hypothetical protein